MAFYYIFFFFSPFPSLLAFYFILTAAAAAATLRRYESTPFFFFFFFFLSPTAGLGSIQLLLLMAVVCAEPGGQTHITLLRIVTSKSPFSLFRLSVV